jgi:WhiB family redox-sensing transcriptional regulator
MTYDDIPEWDNAACATSTNPDIFFDSHYRSVYIAKKICETCPIIEKCAEYALEHPAMAEYGVWGGMSESERRTLLTKKPQSRKGIANRKAK